MNFQARPLSLTKRYFALAAGATILAGAAATVIAYVARFGLDPYVAYAGLVVALATLMLVVGGSRDPERWRILGIVAMFLCFLSFAPLGIAGFLATDAVGSSDAGGLLFLAGLLLLPAAPFVVMVGRPRPESSTGIQAEGQRRAHPPDRDQGIRQA